MWMGASQGHIKEKCVEGRYIWEIQSITKGMMLIRDFSLVQCLRNYTSTAGGAGSIPGQGTKIPRATRYSQGEKNEIK